MEKFYCEECGAEMDENCDICEDCAEYEDQVGDEDEEE